MEERESERDRAGGLAALRTAGGGETVSIYLMSQYTTEENAVKKYCSQLQLVVILQLFEYQVQSHKQQHSTICLLLKSGWGHLFIFL